MGKREERANTCHREEDQQEPPNTIPVDDDEFLSYTNPKDHYHISKSTRQQVNIDKWLADNEGDPALPVRYILILVAIKF